MTSTLVTIETEIIYTNLQYKLLYGRIVSDVKNSDDFIISPTYTPSENKTVLIMGTNDTRTFQAITTPLAQDLKIVAPNGIVICKDSKGSQNRVTNMNSSLYCEIKCFSTLHFSDEESILVIGTHALSTLSSIYTQEAKKQYILQDLNRMIFQKDTKTNITLVIINTLYEVITSLDIKLEDYFKQVIEFPKEHIVRCLDEMINGKIIKLKNVESTFIVNTGSETNNVLSLVCQPEAINAFHICTKGRFRMVLESPSSHEFIILVKTNENIKGN